MTEVTMTVAPREGSRGALRSPFQVRRVGPLLPPVDVRAARVPRCPLWTLGKCAYIAFDSDGVARSCTALRSHALPVHIKNGSEKWR